MARARGIHIPGIDRKKCQPTHNCQGYAIHCQPSARAFFANPCMAGFPSCKNPFFPLRCAAAVSRPFHIALNSRRCNPFNGQFQLSSPSSIPPNQGQSRPIKANQGQSRPIKANQGQSSFPNRCPSTKTSSKTCWVRRLEAHPQPNNLCTICIAKPRKFPRAAHIFSSSASALPPHPIGTRAPSHPVNPVHPVQKSPSQPPSAPSLSLTAPPSTPLIFKTLQNFPCIPPASPRDCPR